MGKEDDVFAHLGTVVADGAHAASSEAISWRTPVRFDPTLLKKLITRHDALQARIAALAREFRSNRTEAWRVARECASDLHELRRSEALWLYPVLARGLASDQAMWRQLVKLRFVMNGLARRVLRSIDELALATRQAAEIAAPVAAVTRALAEYRRHNEAELYALYELMDPRAAAVPTTRLAHTRNALNKSA